MEVADAPQPQRAVLQEAVPQRPPEAQEVELPLRAALGQMEQPLLPPVAEEAVAEEVAAAEAAAARPVRR